MAQSKKNIANDVLATIGNTPLIRLNKIGAGLAATILAKYEVGNPSQSIKDRIARNMIEKAEAEGRLKPGDTIVEATAGNTGMGLALVAAVKGYRCVFVMADKFSQDKIDLMQAFGAEVVITPTDVPPDSPQNYIQTAKRLAAVNKNYFYVDQFANQDNPEVHYQTTAPEIWRDSGGEIDAFVAGVGTGGTISGCGRFFKEKNPNVQIILADPPGSVLSGGQHRPWLVEGIGQDFPPDTYDSSVIDHKIQVTDHESFAMAYRLAREEGMFVGGSSGTAVAAAVKYADKRNKKEVIVALVADTGRNYMSKIFSNEWLTAQGVEID